jgi:hypothetical protein
MSKQIGLPIKADKTVFPTTTLTFVGLDLDSELMEIRLPLDKLGKLKDQFNLFKFKKKSTLRELQSLIGILLASVYKFNCSDVPHLSDKKRHFPLKLSTKISQACISDLVSLLRRR